MSWQRIIIAATIAVAATVSGSTPASANGGPRVVELQRFTDSITGEVIRILADKDTSQTAAGTFSILSGCTYREATIWAEGGGGNVLWRLTQRADWCYDGSVVTSYGRTVTTYVDQSTYWKDLGSWSDSVSSPTTGAWQTVAFRQQHFAECVYFPPPINWVCGGDKYPWIRTYVYGDGTSYVQAGS